MKKVIGMFLALVFVLGIAALMPTADVSAYSGYEGLQLGIPSGYALVNAGNCSVVKDQYLSLAPAEGTNGALDGAEVCQIDGLYTAFKSVPVTTNKYLVLRVKTNVSGLSLRLRPITSDHYGNTSNGQYFWTSYDAAVADSGNWETVVVKYDNFNFYDNELDKTGYLRQLRFDLCCPAWTDGTSYIYVSDVAMFADENAAKAFTGFGISTEGSYNSSNTGSICVDFVYVNNTANDALRDGGETFFECEEGTVIGWNGWAGNYGQQVHRVGFLVNGKDLVWDANASLIPAESPELIDFSGSYGFRYLVNYTVTKGVQNVIPVGQLNDGTVVPLAFAKSASWNVGKEVPPTQAPETDIPTQAPETDVPTQAPETDVPTQAPQTGDMTVAVFALIAAAAVAAYVVFKKRVNG